MKCIPCTIDISHDQGGDYWQISVSAGYTAEAALEFAAMHLGLTDKIIFSNGKSAFTIRPDSVTLGQRTIRVEKTWLDVIWRLFLDTHRNGWTNTAHIDQDLCDKNGSLCITIALTLPTP